MGRKPSDKQRYNFLIDAQIYNDFSLLCDELGLVRSKTIERSLKQFIEQNTSTLSQIKSKKIGGKSQ